MSGKQVVAPWLLPKISQNNEILGPVLNSIKKGAISKRVHISPARDKQAEQGEEAPIATVVLPAAEVAAEAEELLEVEEELEEGVEEEVAPVEGEAAEGEALE